MRFIIIQPIKHFSSSEKLEIGDVAFITENRKPVRNQALAYYREVVKRKSVRVNAFERVEKVQKMEKFFRLKRQSVTEVKKCI